MRYPSTVKCCALVLGLVTVGGISESLAATSTVICTVDDHGRGRILHLRDDPCGKEINTLNNDDRVLPTGNHGRCSWDQTFWVEVSIPNPGPNKGTGWVHRGSLKCPADLVKDPTPDYIRSRTGQDNTTGQF